MWKFTQHSKPKQQKSIFLREVLQVASAKSAASGGRVVQKRLEDVQRWTWGPLRNHVSSTLRRKHSIKFTIKAERFVQTTGTEVVTFTVRKVRFPNCW